MKKSLLFFVSIVASMSLATKAFSRGVVISSDPDATPDPSAMFDVQSDEKGVLVPRMTQAQRDAIPSLATGLLIFQTDNEPGFYFNSGVPALPSWQKIAGSNDIMQSQSCVDIDGNAYPTIVIGNQVWMAENLRVTKYSNGDTIPTNTGGWFLLTSGVYAWYNNDQPANAIYGALHNWYAVTDPRGLCPEGWRAPTDAEWIALTNALGGNSIAGGKLKATSALWSSPNTGATNLTGFSALPGGNRPTYLGGHGFYNFWWSATESSSSIAWGRTLNSSDSTLNYPSQHKSYGFRVRCLRDN